MAALIHRKISKEYLENENKELKIVKRQKLRGTRVFLEPGEIVTKVTSEEDGWITVRTESGEEGEIPVTCISKGIIINIFLSNHFSNWILYF